MINIQQAIKKLEEGNLHFVNDKLESRNLHAKRRMELIDGQEPWAIILSCADSRVVPELIFDTGIGDLFVIRVAGNIANTSTIATIEYAVAHIHTPVIVVLGHENCGAVTAAMADADHGDNLNHLLANIEPAKLIAPDQSVNGVARQNAILTARELVGKSEIIRNTIQKKELEIIPAYYHLATGKVDFYIEN
ncbi:MAG: carbonic anhydrase [Bacteroidales bacterium]|jgi:carbonic anhydrase|nr:carbonic anhydrase [Bacteroidales bacterium]